MECLQKVVSAYENLKSPNPSIESNYKQERFGPNFTSICNLVSKLSIVNSNLFDQLKC